RRRSSKTDRVSWLLLPACLLCKQRHWPRTLAFGFARGKLATKAGWLFRRVLLKSLQIPGTLQLETGPQILRRSDDGMDRPALPVLPSPADAARAALYRDAHDRRGAAWRPGAASAFRRGRASPRVAAWRFRPACACSLRADRRGARFRRDQSQCRLSVRPRAGRPL